jgi:hypothetical protein
MLAMPVFWFLYVWPKPSSVSAVPSETGIKRQ